jgi:hypothetical protein
MATIEATSIANDNLLKKQAHNKKYTEIYDALEKVQHGKVVLIRLDQEWQRQQIERAVRHWAANNGRVRCFLRFPPVADRRDPYSSFYVLLTEKVAT